MIYHISVCDSPYLDQLCRRTPPLGVEHRHENFTDSTYSALEFRRSIVAATTQEVKDRFSFHSPNGVGLRHTRCYTPRKAPAMAISARLLLVACQWRVHERNKGSAGRRRTPRVEEGLSEVQSPGYLEQSGSEFRGIDEGPVALQRCGMQETHPKREATSDLQLAADYRRASTHHVRSAVLNHRSPIPDPMARPRLRGPAGVWNSRRVWYHSGDWFSRRVSGGQLSILTFPRSALPGLPLATEGHLAPTCSPVMVRGSLLDGLSPRCLIPWSRVTHVATLVVYPPLRPLPRLDLPFFFSSSSFPEATAATLQGPFVSPGLPPIHLPVDDAASTLGVY